MKSLRILTVIAIIVSSCYRLCPKWVQFSTSIQVIVEDSLGNNLLVDTVEGSIDPDKIRLYDVYKGALRMRYYQNLDNPYGVAYIDDPGRERIAFSPSIGTREEYVTTYIDWGNGDRDTVVCYVWRNGECNNPIIVKKVWFNGVLMYPDSAITGLHRAFRVVK